MSEFNVKYLNQLLNRIDDLTYKLNKLNEDDAKETDKIELEVLKTELNQLREALQCYN